MLVDEVVEASVVDRCAIDMTDQKARGKLMEALAIFEGSPPQCPSPAPPTQRRQAWWARLPWREREQRQQRQQRRHWWGCGDDATGRCDSPPGRGRATHGAGSPGDGGVCLVAHLGTYGQGRRHHHRCAHQAYGAAVVGIFLVLVLEVVGCDGASTGAEDAWCWVHKQNENQAQLLLYTLMFTTRYGAAFDGGALSTSSRGVRRSSKKKTTGATQRRERRLARGR